jgi:UDP-N-acetylglucosamine pyrophosphorylase
MDPILAQSAEKMRAAGASPPAIAAFISSLSRVIRGDQGLMPESALGHGLVVDALEALPPHGLDFAALARQLVVIKLNGGLGTGMGLDRAKSLLPVKDGRTFLDFIAHQILNLRQLNGGDAPAFFLMNSFATRGDTLDHLQSRHPALAAGRALDFLQGMVPKLDAATLRPVSHPQDPSLEWCPPGHGDIYPSLVGTGILDELLARGIQYAFVSNSDNLGATVDPALLGHFARSGLSFMMEVAERTPADRKGGHLARRLDGRLVLRESAQCPSADQEAFQDIRRHRYFNTNNLWLRLDHLKRQLEGHGGSLPLPLIANRKTVDPSDSASATVIQLETAMGAAIECFEHTGAVLVPRSRFAPVKTTSDLLSIRSDAYEVTPDARLQLGAQRAGRPPLVQLDDRHFKNLSQFEARFPEGAPSLARCDQLIVEGPLVFEAGVVCRGQVTFRNPTATPKIVRRGTYEDAEFAP